MQNGGGIDCPKDYIYDFILQDCVPTKKANTDDNKSKALAIDTLNNLPIYTPDSRYVDYQNAKTNWNSNIKATNTSNKKSDDFGEYQPSDYDVPYYRENTGQVSFNPSVYSPYNNKNEVETHEYIHSAINGRSVMPEWFQNSIIAGSKNPDSENYDVKHDQLFDERAVQIPMSRKSIIDYYGLKPDSIISPELFNNYLKQGIGSLKRPTHDNEYIDNSNPLFPNSVIESITGSKSLPALNKSLNFQYKKGGITQNQYLTQRGLIDANNHGNFNNMTPNQAREILHAKKVNGKPLTEEQYKLFGYLSKGNNKQYQTGGYTPRLVDTRPANYIPAPGQFVNGQPVYHNPQSSISQNTIQASGPQASNEDWNAYLQTPAGIKWKQNQQLKTQTDDYVYTQPQTPVVTPNIRDNFATRATENQAFFNANHQAAGRVMYPIRKTNDITKNGNGIYADSDVYYQPMNGLGQDVGEGKVIANTDFNNNRKDGTAFSPKYFNDYKYPVKPIDTTVKAYKEGGGIPERYKALGFNSVNAPHKTPGAAKSHAVVIKDNGNYELIRFGQQGVTGSPKKEGESQASKTRREDFKARHAANIAKGKTSAAYWANKVKWQDGGKIPFNTEEYKKGGYINKAGRYVHKDGITTSKPGLWSNVYMKNKKELGGIIVPNYQLGTNDFKPIGSTILPGTNTTMDKPLCPPGFAFVGGKCLPLQEQPEANIGGGSSILPTAKTDYVTEQYKTDPAFAKRYDDSIEKYANAQTNKNIYNPQNVKLGMLGINAIAGIAGTMYDNNYKMANARRIQADSEYNPSFSYGPNDYGVAKKGGFLQHLAEGGDVNGSEFDAYDFLFNDEDDKSADDVRTTTEDIAAATAKADEYAAIAKENEQLKADAQNQQDNDLAMSIANEASYTKRMQEEDGTDYSATTDNTTNIGDGGHRNGSNKGFNTYSSPEAGWNALHHQLDLYKTGRTKNNVNGNSSLYHAMSVYAPSSDNNHPKQYAEFIAKNLGISPNTPISQIDVKEWAKSIAKMEGNKSGNNPGNIRPHQYGGNVFQSGGEYEVSDTELQDLIRKGIQFQMM